MLMPFAEVVGEAANATEAYETIRKQKPELVLIDGDLESCTGLELLRLLGKEQLQALVLVSTDSYYATRYFHRFLRAGARGIYLKSSGKMVLHYCVRKLIDAGSSCDPEIAKLIIQKPLAASVIGLTEDQIRVLIRLDFRDEELAEELNTDLNTIGTFIEGLNQQLNVQTRTAAGLKAINFGYVLLPKMPVRNPETGMTEEHMRALKHAQAEIDQIEGNR
jgi:two-component system response regulator DegU